jgi:hypothetical protein
MIGSFSDTIRAAGSERPSLFVHGILRRFLPFLYAIACTLAARTTAVAQSALLLEDFEFASSDEAAAAGVIDLTDLSNSPAFYISGSDENASEGLYSIGTDAVFCQVFCEPGSFIGFRRLVDVQRFPSACPGRGHFAPILHTYGDPLHPGPRPPDLALDQLILVTDAYGDGAFADGPTGTHLWINLVDCEGEVYEFINYSEPSLYSEFWTFNVEMGGSLRRLSPASLTDVPGGDRLLTEIAALEVLIQDADNPPTTVGKWYVDHLRVLEPGALTAAGIASRYLSVTPAAALQEVAVLVEGPSADPDVSCVSAYVQADGTLDLEPFFQTPIEWGSIEVRGVEIRPASTYEVRIDSGTPGNPVLSGPVSAQTRVFGEVDGSIGVDVDDLLCVLDGFAGTFLDCPLVACDLGPCAADRQITLDDILQACDAIAGESFACPSPCPE